MISGRSRVAAVLGWPVEHSRSPQLLGAAFATVGIDAVMVPLRVAPAALAQVGPALAAAGLLGASVTLPHKHAVIAACTSLTPRAQRAGAVNCLTFTDDGIVGDNTDGAGLLADLAAHGWLIADRSVVVLGGGGAARAIVTALIDAGARVQVIARRPGAIDWLPAPSVRPWHPGTLTTAFATADLVIDATPIALEPDTEATAVDALPIDALPAHARIASLVYHREPRLLTRARARSLEVMNGRGMLVQQAALAFTNWTGRPAPVTAMFAAFDQA